MNPKEDLNSLIHSLVHGFARREPESKHTPGRDSALLKYRAERNQRNRTARAARKVQRRRDHGNGHRQRSGRRR